MSRRKNTQLPAASKGLTLHCLEVTIGHPLEAVGNPWDVPFCPTSPCGASASSVQHRGLIAKSASCADFVRHGRHRGESGERLRAPSLQTHRLWNKTCLHVIRVATPVHGPVPSLVGRPGSEGHFLGPASTAWDKCEENGPEPAPRKERGCP